MKKVVPEHQHTRLRWASDGGALARIRREWDEAAPEVRARFVRVALASDPTIRRDCDVCLGYRDWAQEIANVLANGCYPISVMDSLSARAFEYWVDDAYTHRWRS